MTMIDKITANELLDVYGPLLTQHQQNVLDLYYAEDFSYAEISEELDISRSAVMDTVHRATNQLEKYEKIIQFITKKKQILQLCHEKKYNDIEKIL